MNLSYWEKKEWFTDVDFTVIGSGIVGLFCALHLRKQHPKAKILVLEKGYLPQGASTKNAGFACFGSLTELLADLKNHSEEEVLQLVQKRWEGLKLLRQTLGDKAIDFKQYKGYELFKDKTTFEYYIDQQEEINNLLKPVFSAPVFSVSDRDFGFENYYSKYSENQFEGQIDTGKMMQQLVLLAAQNNILLLNNCEVSALNNAPGGVYIETPWNTFKTQQVCIATNGFAKTLLNEEVEPARAQVLITKPIENLKIKGTFHLDEGYYYFRNINNRVLFGGGRNLDFSTENTTVFGQTEVIQQQLEKLLKEVLLPNTPFQIEHRWSGIMGVGPQKKTLVKEIAPNIYCGVRLGGMGVAIGSLIGKELAELTKN